MTQLKCKCLSLVGLTLAGGELRNVLICLSSPLPPADNLLTYAISNSAVDCVLFERRPTITFIMPLIYKQLVQPKASVGDGSL